MHLSKNYHGKELAGWLSLKDTLLHIIWVEDSWINYSIQGLEDPNRPFPYSNYNSWHAIDDYNLTSTLKINEYLDSLTPDDLWSTGFKNEH